MDLFTIVALVVYFVGVVAICRYALRSFKSLKDRIAKKDVGEDE